MNTFINLDYQTSELFKNIKALNKSDRQKIREAYKLAKKYHSGQRRDEGGPYLLHPIRVANLLIEELSINNASTICAAILHDAIEDTKLDFLDVKKKFGIRTVALVQNLTRIKLPDETNKNRYERKHQHFLETMKKDLETRVIKSCDWLDNMRSCSFIPKQHPSRKKFSRWFKEAEEMYLPMAETVNKEIVNGMKEALVKAKRSQSK